MADTDLLFQRPQVLTPGAVDLVFNEDLIVFVEGTVSFALPAPTLSAVGVKPNDATLAATLGGPTLNAVGQYFPTLIYDATLAATLGGPTLIARVGEPNDSTLLISLPGLTLQSTASFDSFTERPTVGAVGHEHQEGTKASVGVRDDSGKGLGTPAGFETRHAPANGLRAGVASGSETAIPTKSASKARHTEADRLGAGLRPSHEDALRNARPSVATHHEEGVGAGTGASTSHQERYRDRRPAISTRHQEALPVGPGFTARFRTGAPLFVRRRTRHQEAMRPPAGRYTPPIQPPFDPCYTPDPDLLFASPFGATPNLVFICDNHAEPPPQGGVVVPVRTVYIVLNDVYLKRVVGNVMLPATDFSLSIDVDSWTWSFSATLPRAALADVEPVGGEPTELEAGVNGSAYRLLVEQISTERTFSRHSIRVSGRGKSAFLASPYAATQSFANATALTAQQIVTQALTINGVPIGWTLDWRLTDWLVPAGVFNMRGSHMEAALAVAAAAGGYIQPHPTANQLLVLPRYPSAPWDWGSVAPDFELPSAVAARESIEWRDKPDYNRVFVSGQQQGVLGRVTRAGTAGDLAAPMVVDALITHADAARQRGISVLADTGRQALVGLSLPVLGETGVIVPGKFVRYVDGASTRLGIVRSTNVSVAGGGANVQQSIMLETRP